MADAIATPLRVAIPLAEPLHKRLNLARSVAKRNDTEFFTPHLLLALLHSPSSPAIKYLDAGRAGLGRAVKDQLTHYVEHANLPPYREFDWLERADIRNARRLAFVRKSPVVADAHLFLSVLQTPSNTQQQLLPWLGNDLSTIFHAAENAFLMEETRTPGTIIKGDSDGK